MIPALDWDFYHHQVLFQQLFLHLIFRICQKVNFQVFKSSSLSVNKWNSSNFRSTVLQGDQGYKVLAVVAENDGVSVAFLGRPMERQVNSAHLQRSKIGT